MTGTPNVMAGSDLIFTAPMVADPGTVQYGINVDWLGKVVEAVSGVGLDVAIKEGITGPLGMDQTTFLMNDDAAAELHADARQGRGRHLGRHRRDPEPGSRTTGPAGTACTGRRATTSSSSGRCCAAASSTASGSCSQSTVDAAFTNQIGDLDFPAEIPTADPASSCDFTRVPASSGATACCSTPRTSRACGGRGAERWAGLCNTHFWVDRTAGVCGSIYSNFLPFVTAGGVELYADFERALYASL